MREFFIQQHHQKYIYVYAEPKIQTKWTDSKKKGEELKFFRRICRGVHSSHSCVCSGIYSSYTLYSWRKNSVWRAIAMSSAIYILHEWSRTKEAAEANSRKNITNTIGKRQLNNNTTRNIIKKEENRTIYDWNKTKKKNWREKINSKKKLFFEFLGLMLFAGFWPWTESTHCCM